MATRSLTKLFQPEYKKLLAEVYALGWAHLEWEPFFRSRWRRRWCGATGHCLGNSKSKIVWEVCLYIGRRTTLGDALETLAHEVAHAVTVDETVDHGPRFQAALRLIVRKRWPLIGEWEPAQFPGKTSTYAEDYRILTALYEAYPSYTQRIV